MKVLRFAVLLVIATLLSTTLAQTTVTFWQFSTRDAYIEAWNNAIAEFEAQNPDITVEMEVVPWAEQQQRLVSALTTGGLPDVSFLGNNVVAQFQAIGVPSHPSTSILPSIPKRTITMSLRTCGPATKGTTN